MALLTQELLKKKLSSWVLSSKIPETLGFDDSKATEIKQELAALVELGLLERDGERRGLKFRFKSSTNQSNSNESELDNEVVVDEEDIPLPIAIKSNDNAPLRAFFANRDLIKSETEGNKTPLQLLSVLTDTPIKDASVLSHTLSYKKTSEGDIIITFWMGCVKMYERQCTLTAFNKILTSELKSLSKPISTVV